MTSSVSNLVDTIVVGAGLAGLVAAERLHRAGQRLVVLEKGRGVGGRLATRRVGEMTFDHGAQFLTARDPQFVATVEQWAAAGVVQEWCRGFTGGAEGHVRWRGTPGMTAVAKHLAVGLDVRTGTTVTGIAQGAGGWVVTTAEGEWRAPAVLVTSPVPQTLALLDAGAVPLDAAARSRLAAIAYEPCLAVLAELDRPSALPPPGARAWSEGPVAWLADNQQKGLSARPCITLHASAAYSAAHWTRDRAEVARELWLEVQPLLQAEPLDLQVHGWKYARPSRLDPCGCWQDERLPGLVLAGDAFSAPRVEGAFLSGWAAAAALGKPGKTQA